MASSIPTARGVLFDRLYAASGLNGVQVTYGPPDAYEDTEVVTLMGVRDPDEEPATLGPGNKDESYIIDVGIKVHGRDRTAQDVDARSYALADVVRTEVEGSGDLTLGGSVMWALVSSVTSIAPTPDGVVPAEGGGFGLVLRVAISCRARLNRG